MYFHTVPLLWSPKLWRPRKILKKPKGLSKKEHKIRSTKQATSNIQRQAEGILKEMSITNWFFVFSIERLNASGVNND